MKYYRGRSDIRREIHLINSGFFAALPSLLGSHTGNVRKFPLLVSLCSLFCAPQRDSEREKTLGSSCPVGRPLRVLLHPLDDQIWTRKKRKQAQLTEQNDAITLNYLQRILSIPNCI